MQVENEDAPTKEDPPPATDKTKAAATEKSKAVQKQVALTDSDMEYLDAVIAEEKAAIAEKNAAILAEKRAAVVASVNASLAKRKAEEEAKAADEAVEQVYSRLSKQRDQLHASRCDGSLRKTVLPGASSSSIHACMH